MSRIFSRILPNSFLNQLFLYFTLIVVLLAVFCIPLWLDWTYEIEDGRNQLLSADANHMARVFLTHGPAELATVIADRVGTDFNTLQVLLLQGPQNKRLAGNLQQPPASSHRPGESFTFSIQVNGHRSIVQMVQLVLPGNYQLWVGRDVTRYANLESIFLRGLSIVVLIAFIVVGLAIYGARCAALERIAAINHTTTAIVEGDLSQRLPVSGVVDEFDMLARTVNRMLDQIDDLVQNVKHSSNVIAHDLRTPLAELRAHLEQLSLTHPEPEETFAVIDISIGDVDRIIAIFNAILRLAEIDSGTRRTGFKPFDVTEVIEEAVEFYCPVGQLKGITLEARCNGDLTIHGDSLLLAQALGNLIDNALKYAGDGGKIVVSGQKNDANCVDIVVADNGPGIAAQDMGKVADRFFRADPSRSSPGIGLGLAIVSAVAKLHGGLLVLSNNAPGLRATIKIAAAKFSGHQSPRSSYSNQGKC